MLKHHPSLGRVLENSSKTATISRMTTETTPTSSTARDVSVQGRSHLAMTQTEPHTLETVHVGTLESRVHEDRLFPFEWHLQELLRQPISSEQTQPQQCWR